MYFHMTKLSTQDFIEKAKQIHGDLYDYSKVEYANSWTPIPIRCRFHGVFLQIPDNHIHRKSGCPRCGVRQRKQNQPKQINAFIVDAKGVHSNKYDYSKVVYRSAKDNVEIICPLHNSFFQCPNNHLNGEGCPRCSGNEAKQLTIGEFIDKAKVIHNGKYDYSLSCYTNRYTKLTILCPVHGKFRQSPYAHLKLQGCPRCRKSKGEKEIERFLQNKNVKFESPKAFSTCINPKTGWHLYFDFYVSAKNLLIEFDGYQHFRPYYRDKYNINALKNRQERDAVKTQWAAENGLVLLRIKYTQMQKINSILSRIFP